MPTDNRNAENLVVHWIAYEPPLAASAGCGQAIHYLDGVVVFDQRGRLSTDPGHVTCKRCLAFLEKYPIGAGPRRLAPSDEVPW